MNEQPNNPLHGVRLDTIIEYLVDHFEGWEGLGERIQIRCFNENPSVKSSLTFLRKTPWARQKVEELYVRIINKK
ncbi:VF530 family DNA-binding protein [Sphingobacterium spiritivorum]|uniref:VF530 family protein n=1 Tax=Sphingobacterium spiritivorum TaxID=258 RepID=UPI003DA3B5CA